MSWRRQAVGMASQPPVRDYRAFTLVELLALVALIALLVLTLAPSLRAAAGRSKTQVCLDNLRSLGVAVRLYAEESGTLPGPLHPAVWHGMLRDDDDPQYQYLRERQLAWRLRVALGSQITDRLITCPVMGDIVPDSSFDHFYEETGRPVYAAHYALNSYGAIGGGTRNTDPSYYFGYYGYFPDDDRPPIPLGAVRNADREWMIADAWYRPRVNAGFLELQQEGPYQWSWTGESLPNFAPHERRGSRNYSFTSSDARNSQSARIRNCKSDGITNTLFFDGHAAGVPSKTYLVGPWELLYGFRGTVNPAQIDPPPDSPAWDGVWR
jgi:prepilin-type processing-associated H-X9-DG protein